MNRVLVIKLGALGDVVLALAAMRHIRQAHPEAEITALTTPSFSALLAASPYVDRVETDGRPSGLRDTLALFARLRRGTFDRVYDLQTSSRSSSYLFGLAPNPPEWSGIALGCSHPHRNPDRDAMHTLERHADQLKYADIWPDAPTAPGSAPPPDLSWLDEPPPQTIPAPYALLIPGGSAHRPKKRWPVANYTALAEALAARGLTSVVIGGAGERELAAAIPSALDLTGRTTFGQVAALARGAEVAIGNDTGPTHLIAATGAPTVALFSDGSDPALTAPRGPKVTILRGPSLADLTVDDVLTAAT